VRVPTGRGFGPDAARAAILALASDACTALGGLDSVGIGFPGLVNYHQGIARSTVILDGWHDAALAREVSDALGLPCAIDNDVNAAGIHEQALRGVPDLLYIAVGTGIGGAIVLGGTLWRGARGFSGEIGHMSIDHNGPLCGCGRRGCLNQYASGTAIERAAGLQLGQLAAGAEAPPAVLAAAADALGIAIGTALNILDVPLVVLGGGIVELGDSYVDAVAARARRECFREIGDACQIVKSRGGYDAGALGAAALGAGVSNARSPAT